MEMSEDKNKWKSTVPSQRETRCTTLSIETLALCSMRLSKHAITIVDDALSAQCRRSSDGLSRERTVAQ